MNGPGQYRARYLLFCTAAAALLFWGCARQPSQEVEMARAAVDAAISDGAEKFDPAGARKINDELAGALAEIKTQDAKFLKDYKRAKEMLAGVRADAGRVKAGLPEKKLAAKKQAEDALASASGALGELRALIDRARKTRADKVWLGEIEKEAEGIEESHAEAGLLIRAEDYVTATSSALALRGKAGELSARLREEIGATSTRTAERR